MSREVVAIDKRQFGRRTVLWHAWVRVAGRDREPCIVRNFSVAGALLEFEGDLPVAGRFTLIIDEYDFTSDCYVRHRGATALGVYFSEIDETAQAPQTVSPNDVVALIRREGGLRSRQVKAEASISGKRPDHANIGQSVNKLVGAKRSPEGI